MARLGDGLGPARIVAAGALGTVALTAFERLEWRLLGKKPVYSPERIAKRLFGNERLTPLLRFTYGPAVGTLFGILRAPPLVFAAALAGAELHLLPWSGATPRLRRWSPKEMAMLFAHTAAFSVATAAILRQMAFRASRKALAV